MRWRVEAILRSFWLMEQRPVSDKGEFSDHNYRERVSNNDVRTKVKLNVMRQAILLASLAGFFTFVIGAHLSFGDRVSDQADGYERGEEFPGGDATTLKSPDHVDVFSQSSRGIGFDGEFKFKLGNAIFRRLWVSAPSSTKSSDGLGPLFNARACQNCHFKDGRGHPPAGNWPDDDAVSMFLRLSVPPQTDEERRALARNRLKSIPEPIYGGQLQDLAIQGHDGEGRMHITYTDMPVTLADGTVVTLRKPTYKITNLKYGPLHEKTTISPRVAPQMIGLGLLEAVLDKSILENADPHDTNGDGVSGRANRVLSLQHKKVMLGRFGWKAGAATIFDQSVEAFSGDIGLSTTVRPNASGDCTGAQEKCLTAPDGKTPPLSGVEVSDELLDLAVFYAQNLAVPKRRDAKDAMVLKGKKIFFSAGCAACHRPKFKTGHVEGQKHLSNQTIWPYTDLLLHDMGEGLADNRPEGQATGREWRTPPLWGIGLTDVVSGHTFFLHDGRARNVTEAILWHGGEANAARNAFVQMSVQDRAALLKFVNSL